MMHNWSLERLICDATRYAKAVVAPVLAPMLDFVYPPLTEPTPKVCRAHREKVCIFCDEDSDALWVHPADGAEELAEREAEEEVWESADEARERIGEVDDFIPMPTRRARRTAAQFYKATLNDEDRERIGEVDDFVSSEYSEPTVSTATYSELLQEVELRRNDDPGTGAINGGAPQQVTLSGREYERYLDGALNEPIDNGPAYVLGLDSEVDEKYCLLCCASLHDGDSHNCPRLPAEPPLTADELVAVRGLIQERYENNCTCPSWGNPSWPHRHGCPANLCMIVNPSAGHLAACAKGHTIFTGAAATLADGDPSRVSPCSTPSAREDKQRCKSVDPHTDSPPGETGQAVHPPGPPARPADGPSQLASAGHPNPPSHQQKGSNK